jgi:hypothetical protein
MHLQAEHFPDRQLPWIQTTLTEGGSHDQADAEWIVIRTQLRGHNHTLFGRPAPGRPSGRPGSGRLTGIFCMF